MKRPAASSAVRLGWAIFACAALGAYSAIVGPGEARVRAIEAHARELYDLSERNDRLRASAVDLPGAKARVARDLAALQGESTTAGATLAALHVLERESDARHLVVAGIAPDSAGPAGDTQDVRVMLHGRYPDVVAAVADLSRSGAFAEVLRADLDGSATDAQVDATVRARLYRGIEALDQEAHHAPTVIR